MANYGFSFAPTSAMTLRGAQAPPARPQEAVSFRSLALPRQDVPNQIAAPSLTGAPGALGTPPAELLRMLMQMLGGQAQRSMAAPAAPPSGAPQGLQPQGYAPPAAPMMAAPASTAPRVAFDSQARGTATPISMNFGASYGNDDREQPGGALAPPSSLLPLPSYTPRPMSPSQRGADNVQFEYGRATPISMNFGPTPGEPDGLMPTNAPPQRIDGPGGGPLPQGGGFDFTSAFRDWLG